MEYNRWTGGKTNERTAQHIGNILQKEISVLNKGQADGGKGKKYCFWPIVRIDKRYELRTTDLPAAGTIPIACSVDKGIEAPYKIYI